jgi:hypothetical protein
LAYEVIHQCVFPGKEVSHLLQDIFTAEHRGDQIDACVLQALQDMRVLEVRTLHDQLIKSNANIEEFMPQLPPDQRPSVEYDVQFHTHTYSYVGLAGQCVSELFAHLLVRIVWLTSFSTRRTHDPPATRTEVVLALQRAGMLNTSTTSTSAHTQAMVVGGETSQPTYVFSCPFFNDLIPEAYLIHRFRDDIIHVALAEATTDDCIHALVAFAFVVNHEALRLSTTTTTTANAGDIGVEATQALMYVLGTSSDQCFQAMLTAMTELLRQFHTPSANRSEYGASAWQRMFGPQ